MKDFYKTKTQLVRELEALRTRMQGLAEPAARHAPGDPERAIAELKE